jgi:hypothetical protein
VKYEVAVELDRQQRTGGVPRCHLIIPDATTAVCGHPRQDLYITDRGWADVSRLYRRYNCEAVAQPRSGQHPAP